MDLAAQRPTGIRIDFVISAKRGGTAGFTLLESLISLIILAFIFVGGMSFYFNSDQYLTVALHKRLAMEIANAKMEDLRRLGYSSLPDPANPGDPVSVSVGQLAGQVGASVSDIDDSQPADGTADFKAVQVTVTWTEPGKPSPSQVELVTYMAP